MNSILTIINLGRLLIALLVTCSIFLVIPTLKSDLRQFNESIGESNFIGSLQQKALSSTVLVQTILDSQVNGSGSATLIKKSFKEDKFIYLFLCCNHVLSQTAYDPWDDLAIIGLNRSEKGEVLNHDYLTLNQPDVVCHMINASSESDFGVIMIASKIDLLPNVTVANIANKQDIESISVNSQVVCAGHPIGETSIAALGTILQVGVSCETPRISLSDAVVVDSIIIPGMSGGGVYNDKGLLVGFISYGLSDCMLGFIPLDQVYEKIKTTMNLF